MNSKAMMVMQRLRCGAVFSHCWMLQRTISTKIRQEITQVPRTPAWSLTELHQEGVRFNQNETILTTEKLRELAELCHLHVDDSKLPSMLQDVESIIQCTKTIQAMTLDENIDDLYATDAFDAERAPLRDDIVTEGNCPDQILANAAEKAGYFFKVPKVLQD